jgi:hypothetical protein
MEAFSDLKEKLQVPFFMDIIILAAWSIWILRNNKIFKNSNPTIASCRSKQKKLLLVGRLDTIMSLEWLNRE